MEFIERGIGYFCLFILFNMGFNLFNRELMYSEWSDLVLPLGLSILLALSDKYMAEMNRNY